MFLSKLVLNPRSKQALKEADDPYQMHRTLSKAFGDRLREARMLFRVDCAENRGPVVIVQSRIEPAWGAIPTGYADACCKSFDLAVTREQRLGFRLLVKPIKREKASGKRVGLREDDQLRAWLDRKGTEGGFTIEGLRIIEARWRDSKGATQSKPLGAVQFDGVLVVIDPDKLCEAVRNGIGPQKAYGFGLLSLAPLRE